MKHSFSPFLHQRHGYQREREREREWDSVSGFFFHTMQHPTTSACFFRSCCTATTCDSTLFDVDDFITLTMFRSKLSIFGSGLE
mmetsp:Transcript_12819/g.18932  ORF Transcript_12819/g.18932 Transcript_12819/m.18932 type:complete len:84 (-) Transcript_12819:92-343(-)